MPLSYFQGVNSLKQIRRYKGGGELKPKMAVRSKDQVPCNKVLLKPAVTYCKRYDLGHFLIQCLISVSLGFGYDRH